MEAKTTLPHRGLFDRILNKPVKAGMLVRAVAELTEMRAIPAPEVVNPVPINSLKPGLRVLVADDNPVNQKVATYLLKMLGAHVHNASTGLEALVMLRALTANAFATDREECLAAGMDDFLTKPLERNRLEQALMRVLGSPGQATPRSLPAESVREGTKNIELPPSIELGDCTRYLV